MNRRSDYRAELEQDEAERLTRAGHIVPVCVGSENTYYQNAAGLEFFCKDYPNAEKWPKEYTAEPARIACACCWEENQWRTAEPVIYCGNCGTPRATEPGSEPPTLEQATAAFVLAMDAAIVPELYKQRRAAHENRQDFALPASQRRIWCELTALFKSH